jgi:hypothetical protein
MQLDIFSNHVTCMATSSVVHSSTIKTFHPKKLIPLFSFCGSSNGQKNDALLTFLGWSNQGMLFGHLYYENYKCEATTILSGAGQKMWFEGFFF